MYSVSHMPVSISFFIVLVLCSQNVTSDLSLWTSFCSLSARPPASSRLLKEEEEEEEELLLLELPGVLTSSLMSGKSHDMDETFERSR